MITSLNPKKKVRVLPVTVAISSVLMTGLAHSASPTAVDDSRTVPANSSITMNVLGNDFDTDGDLLNVTSVIQPQHGTATVNSDNSITYVPDADYQGPDSFTYFIEDVSPQSSVASAIVSISVTSPTTYIDKKSNTANVATTLTGACTDLQDKPSDELSGAQQDLLDRCLELSELEISNPEQLEEVVRQIAPEETTAKMRTATNSSRTQTQAVQQRIGLLQNNAGSVSFNGQSLSGSLAATSSFKGGSAGDTPSTWSRLGLFASVQQEGAEHDQTTLESGYEYTGNNLTIGADYLIRNNLVLGGAFGWTQSDTDLSSGNGNFTSDVYTFIAYGTYFTDSFSIDLQAGYGSMDFESVRRIHFTTTDETDVSATGFTSGEQFLFNGQIDWAWNREALSILPFARFDYVNSQIDGYGENGAGGLNMTISEQTIDQLTVSAGFQTTYAISNSWGVLIPTANVRLLSEVESNRDEVFGQFASDPDPENRFVLSADDADTLYYQIGVGTSAVLKGGISLFIEYQQLLGQDNLSTYQIQSGVRCEL
ncbi:autotransporter domain-containing protein [Hahella ganghwensis]|uniref:autotransporter domain-containing protein n=1 Tax=Hahella ganghwensis TaxID=286420 RepID=UPI00037D8EBF|nr:autotransporter domain-containing protein [Hahella ganghwensis]